MANFDVTDRKQFTAWLNTQPREVAVLIAARAALRMLPAQEEYLTWSSRRSEADSSVTLSAFRAAATGWVAGMWPAHAVALRAAGRSASSAITETELRLRKHVPTAIGIRAAEATQASMNLAALTAFAVAAPDSANASAYAANVAPVVYSAATVTLEEEIQGVIAGHSLAGALWQGNVADWVLLSWNRIKSLLLGLDEDWEVWTDWYEARLRGDPANEALEVARVLIPDDIWKQGPKILNAKIKRLIEEHDKAGPQPPDPISPSELGPELPSVPAQRPAAIEPVWENGRLTLPGGPVSSDQSPDDLRGALTALCDDLDDLANDLEGEANIDRRFVSYIRRIAKNLPASAPRQHDLFRLGHGEEFFARYATTVNDQWPEVLAARFHAAALQFDRTLRQFPIWREFKRNAARETLTDEQIDAATHLAQTAANSFEQGEAAGFVDAYLPRAVRDLAASEPDDEQIEVGKELLALDLIESVNNVLKAVAEWALAVGTTVGGVLSEAGQKYFGGVGRGFAEEAGRQGPKDGAALFKWLRRFAIGGPPAGGGLWVLLHRLMVLFPDQFGWLHTLAPFLF